MYYREYNELHHYGVKGMKWGVRRAKDTVSNYRAKRKAEEEAYRKKLSNISKNRYNNADAVARARYRNQSLKGRVGGEALRVATAAVLKEVMLGNTKRYQNMSKEQLALHLTSIAAGAVARTATNVVVKDALAKSASKRYNDDGKFKKGAKRQGLYTKERKIESLVSFGVTLAPIVGVGGAAWMRQAQAERAANEARVRQWGGRILNESADNFVYGSYKVK